METSIDSQILLEDLPKENEKHIGLILLVLYTMSFLASLMFLFVLHL